MIPVSFRTFKVAEKFLVQKQDFCQCLNLRLASESLYTYIFIGKDMLVPGTRHAAGRGEGREVSGRICVYKSGSGWEGWTQGNNIW